MKTKLAVALFLLVILGLGLAGQAFVQAVQAASGVPGVSAGDYFFYSITAFWSTTNAHLAVPNELLVENSTLHYNVTVEAVQDTNVTILNSWVFKNGTALTAPSLSNVDSGVLFDYLPGEPAFQGLFDANLAVNSLLYPSGNESLTINQTVTRDYASGKRATNVVSGSFSVQDVNNNTGTQTTTLYIDKATGVMVERDDDYDFSDYTASIIWTLTDTNLWTVSAAPLPLSLTVTIVAIAVAIAIIAVAVFYRERKKSRKKRRH